MHNGQYEKMLPSDFASALRELPVFYVPLGLLEWHGDHLPLGLDMMKAHGICLKIKERIGGGIVLPPLYIGRPGYSTYLGTITFSEALVTLMLNELFVQLKKVGAKLIVFVVGHYGPAQEECIERFRKVISHENPEVKVIAHKESFNVKIDGVEPSDHAGLWETSMFLSLYPELVKLENLDKPLLKQKVYFDAPNNYYHESDEWKWDNDVRTATAETGNKAINGIVDEFEKEIYQYLQADYAAV